MAVFRRKRVAKVSIFPKIEYWIEWIAWGAKMLVWIVECLRNMPERPHLPIETSPAGETEETDN